MEEALFLTKFATKVYIAHRRDSFRASKIMQDRVLDNDKIEVLWNKEVNEIHGKESVSSISLKDTSDDSSSELNIDGVFMAIGHTPNVEIGRAHV